MGGIMAGGRPPLSNSFTCPNCQALYEVVKVEAGRNRFARGVSVNTPMTRPTQSFARRWRKNDPWPQSCWIMNSRTRKPAAGTASNRPTQ